MKSKSKKLMIVLLCIALAMTFSFTGSVFAEEGQPATTESSTAVENSAQTENAPAAESSAQEGKTSVANKEASADTENTEAVEEKATSEEKTVETPKSDESASETKDNGSASKGEESSDVKTQTGDTEKQKELEEVWRKVGSGKVLRAAKSYGKLVMDNPASQEEEDAAIEILRNAVAGYKKFMSQEARAETAITKNTPELETAVNEAYEVYLTDYSKGKTSKDELKEAAITANADMERMTDVLRSATTAQLEKEKKSLQDGFPTYTVDTESKMANGKNKAVFTLNYVIGKDYGNQKFTFDPYSDFFRIARIYGLENWEGTFNNRVYQYYPSMPGDRNYVIIKITNKSGKKFYYKNGGFGLSIASDGTVVPEVQAGTEIDFYDLVSLAFSENEVGDESLVAENKIDPSRTVNSYIKEGNSVPVTEELLQTLFGKDSDTSTWGETGCTLFSGFALDGPRITNANVGKSFGWSTPITLVRDADPIPVPTKTIRISKVWVTDDGGTPAESVDVQILKNGKAYKVVTLSDANGWNYSEAVIDDGAKYTAQEVTSVDGFVSSVTEDGDTITITNDDVKKPDKPVKPDKPTKPDKPVKPTKPDKPARPSKPAKPKKPAVSVPVEQVKANVPKTGDENHVGLYGGMLVLAAAGAAVLLRLRRKSGK